MEIEITKKEGRIIDKIFGVGVLIKAVFGFFEVLAGILLAISGKLVINNFIINLAQQEIADDSDDFIANFLINTANSFYYDARIFAVIYLMAHGVINIFLAISLIKGKIKFYPAIMALLGVFIIYQIYKYFHTLSLSLLMLTLFDVFFVFIVWLEYKKRKKTNKK